MAQIIAIVVLMLVAWAAYLLGRTVYRRLRNAENHYALLFSIITAIVSFVVMLFVLLCFLFSRIER